MKNELNHGKCDRTLMLKLMLFQIAEVLYPMADYVAVELNRLQCLEAREVIVRTLSAQGESQDSHVAVIPNHLLVPLPKALPPSHHMQSSLPPQQSQPMPPHPQIRSLPPHPGPQPPTHLQPLPVQPNQPPSHLHPHRMPHPTQPSPPHLQPLPPHPIPQPQHTIPMPQPQSSMPMPQPPMHMPQPLQSMAMPQPQPPIPMLHPQPAIPMPQPHIPQLALPQSQRPLSARELETKEPGPGMIHHGGGPPQPWEPGCSPSGMPTGLPHGHTLDAPACPNLRSPSPQRILPQPRGTLIPDTVAKAIAREAAQRVAAESGRVSQVSKKHVIYSSCKPTLTLECMTQKPT